MSFFSRLANLARTRRVDRELDDEQQFHVDARVDALVAAGMTREAARAEAMRRFGGRLRAREASREVRLLPWLESVLRDAWIGLRLLRRDAGVSSAAIASLALAIGACAAAFSLIDALMLRPLPVRDPESLVYLARGDADLDIRLATLISHPYLERLRTTAPSRIEIFSMGNQVLRQAIVSDGVAGQGSGAAEKLRVQLVSGNAMGVLGLGASAGRLLYPSDDVTPGAHPVAVISHAFWARRFGAAPEAIGRSIQIEGQSPEARLAAARQLLDEVRRLPGVQAASLSNWARFKGWWSAGGFRVPGHERVQANIFGVSPGFFATLGARVLDGRDLDARDLTLEPPTAVVVNETFARRFFPGESAVGRRIERDNDGRTTIHQIVGVVRDLRDGSVRGEIGPEVFEPKAGPDGTLQVRTSMAPSALTARMRELLPRVHPSLRLTDVTLQTSLVGNALLRERLLAILSGFFACVGLILAGIGLYGVSSFAVAQRVREIGIRMALGSGRGAVLRAVLGGVAGALAAGAAAGLAGGLYFAGFLRSLIFEIQPLDVSSLVLPVAALLTAAATAAIVPALRATRVDPVVALREE